MNRFCLSLAVAACLATPLASQAAESSQQNRMKDCAAQYKAQGIAKSEHKAFMSKCLKKDSNMATAPAAKTAAPAPAAKAAATQPVVAGKEAQQNKMKSCNAEAKTKSLAGQPRKDFMKTCLSAAA